MSDVLSNARKEAHRVFDVLWSNKEERRMAYTWLVRKLGIRGAYCHFAQMSLGECRSAIALIKRIGEDKAREEMLSGKRKNRKTMNSDEYRKMLQKYL